MTPREQAIASVSRYCDLEERLKVLPPSSQVRGLYSRSVEAALGKVGRADKYREIFPERFSAMGWYPASEFMVRLVVGASMLTSPERVHEGMFEIGRRNAVAFSESLIGRAVLRLLSRDPRKLLQQAVAGRRQSNNNGHWELTFPTDRSAVISMSDEYFYIESNLLGAAQGTFDAIALPVKTEVVLDTPYSGRHYLSW